jgi:hypothetical protein
MSINFDDHIDELIDRRNLDKLVDWLEYWQNQRLQSCSMFRRTRTLLG